MNDIGKRKRETQRWVIALFRDEPKTEQPETGAAAAIGPS
jgi:hypothetical protein